LDNTAYGRMGVAAMFR